MANILYRGSAVPSSTNSAGANNAPLTNDQIDKNLYALDLAKFEKSGGTISGDTTFASNVNITGNFTVGGTTTQINALILQVSDKNIEIGKVSTPTDTTADGGGITLLGSTNKTIVWDSANANWTSSEHFNIASSKSFKINNAVVLNSTTLGSSVVSSSLTKLGTGAGFVKSDSSGNLTVDTNTYLTSVGSGALTLGINGSAGSTNTTVTIGTGTGFNANSSGAVTYDLKVGPALTALAAIMTTAGAGFIRRGSSADTYTIDTNTYLTSYTEVDTLSTVTSRGASTSTAVTFSGGLSATTGSFSGSIGASNFSGSSSGTNTGDETLSSIKTKLGITTLSGSNTGDQVIPTTLPASDVYSWAKASVKPSYAYSEISGTPSSLPASDVYSWAKASVKPSYTQNEIGSGALTATTGTFSDAIRGTSLSIIASGSAGTMYMYGSAPAGNYSYIQNNSSQATTPNIIFGNNITGVLGYFDYLGYFTATGNVTAFSDSRLKTNVTKIDNALTKVNQLNGYTFDRVDVKSPRQTGVIAQEVLKVLPEAVSGSEETTYSVAYGNMIGLMIEAIKELNAKVEDLQNQLAINK